MLDIGHQIEPLCFLQSDDQIFIMLMWVGLYYYVYIEITGFANPVPFVGVWPATALFYCTVLFYIHTVLNLCKHKLTGEGLR